MPDADSDDLDRWIASFRGPLIGLLASWGLDWRAAEEVAQDTFAEAWVGRERLRVERDDLEAVGRWLRGIAFHLFRAHRRRAQRGGADARAEVGDLAAPEAAPFDEHEERRALLVEAFAQLNAEQQTVLRMHYLEESSARDVAALLGVTPKSVEMRLARARIALRERVARIAPTSASKGRS